MWRKKNLSIAFFCLNLRLIAWIEPDQPGLSWLPHNVFAVSRFICGHEGIFGRRAKGAICDSGGNMARVLSNRVCLTQRSVVSNNRRLIAPHEFLSCTIQSIGVALCFFAWEPVLGFSLPAPVLRPSKGNVIRWLTRAVRTMLKLRELRVVKDRPGQERSVQIFQEPLELLQEEGGRGPTMSVKFKKSLRKSRRRTSCWSWTSRVA